MAWAHTPRHTAMQQPSGRASLAAAPLRMGGACRYAAAAARCRSRSSPAVVVKALTVINEQVTLSTATGDMQCQVFRPTAPGRYPGLVLFSEIFQNTDPILRSSRMMAGHGFVVITPEIYHEFLEPGTALSYTQASGADKGNELKITKELSSYDSDSAACVKWLMSHELCTGKIGSMGFCIGGHLAYRGALNKGVLAGACLYPTDLHKSGLGKGAADDSLQRAPEFAADGTEMLFIWGKQDPHIPREGRAKIWQTLEEAGVNFSWHEVNGQHAFMRDEGPRYDPELALQVYSMLINFFRRKLGEGCLPPPKDAVEEAKESKH